nr:hypothetical protein [Tanacetum cinerariifolium]
WELKVMGTDLASYTQRFQELALLCGRLFSGESDKVKKYVGGLPNMIHGSVVASKPKTMQEAIEIATELMDKKVLTFVERETASKRKLENTSRTTQNQQQQQHSNKRQNTSRVYTTTSGGKKQYGGSKPLCAKCNYHHDGPCAPKCHNSNKIGHFARDCRVTELHVKSSKPPIQHRSNARRASNQGNATRLSIISCTKTEKYVKKEFPIFLAHITTKEVEEKSKEKRLEDVPVVRYFTEVFPKDLPGLPPIRPVEFQIDLVPGAAQVARAPYR